MFPKNRDMQHQLAIQFISTTYNSQNMKMNDVLNKMDCIIFMNKDSKNICGTDVFILLSEERM